MYSISFPDIFDNGRVKLYSDNDATLSNIHLLLLSWKTSLFGDPYFGTNLVQFIYDQNNILLRDVLIDDIYTSLQEFIPQISVDRNKIQLIQKDNSLFVTINCINKMNNDINLYEIKLTQDE